MPRHPPCALCSLSHKHSTKTTRPPHSPSTRTTHSHQSCATQHKRPDNTQPQGSHPTAACIYCSTFASQTPTPIHTGPTCALEDARVHCSTTKHHTHQHPHPTTRSGFSEGGPRENHPTPDPAPKDCVPRPSPKTVSEDVCDPSGPNSVPRPPTRTSRPGSTPTPSTRRHHEQAVLRPTTHRGSRSSTIPLANTTKLWPDTR